MSRTVNNTGIGALYASFTIRVTSGAPDLTSADLGRAVALSGPNEVSKGSDGGRLLGRLETIHGDVATVQIRGVMRLPLSGDNYPGHGEGVVIDGAGAVYRAPALTAHDPAGGDVARGFCLAVNTSDDWADVLL